MEGMQAFAAPPLRLAARRPHARHLRRHGRLPDAHAARGRGHARHARLPRRLQGPRVGRAADAGVELRPRPALPQRHRRADRAEGRLPDRDARLGERAQGARRTTTGRRTRPRTSSTRPSSAASASATARSAGSRRARRRRRRQQPATLVDRLRGRRDLAGVLRLGDLGEQLARAAGPGSMPERRGELVAAHQRRRRARRRASASASPSIGARARGAGRSPPRLAAAGGEAVGDRSSVTSAATGSQAHEVAVDRRRPSGRSWTRKPRRRWWRASAATCARSRSLARRRPRIARDIAAPSRSWPGKPTRPSPMSARVTRLGDVVQQRAEAQRAAAREVVRRAARRAAPPRPARARRRRRARGSRSSSIVCVEHLERVAVDVEVVVDGLLDAAQRVELGQHDGGRAEVVEQREAGERVVGADDARAARRRRARRRRRSRPGGVLARRRDRRRRRPRSPSSTASRATRSDAQRVVGERPRADHPQAPRREVLQAAADVERRRRRRAARRARSR